MFEPSGLFSSNLVMPFTFKLCQVVYSVEIRWCFLLVSFNNNSEHSEVSKWRKNSPFFGKGKKLNPKQVEGRQPTCTLRTPVTSAEPPDSENVTDHCDRHRPFLHIHNTVTIHEKTKTTSCKTALPASSVPPLWNFQELTAHTHLELYLTNTPGFQFHKC